MACCGFNHCLNEWATFSDIVIFHSRSVSVSAKPHDFFPPGLSTTGNTEGVICFGEGSKNIPDEPENRTDGLNGFSSESDSDFDGEWDSEN